MESRATLRYTRMAPRKLRRVLNAIRNKPVEIALGQLKLAERSAADVVYKVLASAVANAHDRFGQLDTAALFVTGAYANQGPMLKRFRPRAMGRAGRILKKTSHVTIVVGDFE